MQFAAVPVRANGSVHRAERFPHADAERFAGLNGVASVTRWRRDQQIVRPDRTNDSWHRLVCGAARQCVLRHDGQRQIVDFLLPGDVLVPADTPAEFALEAITDETVVASFPVRQVEQSAGSTGYPESDLRNLALAGAHRLQRQILILGRASAAGKVSAFLLDMAGRLSAADPSRFELPMSRYDIADYLVMSVETVSRSLTSLRSRGAVKFFGGRGLKIVDREVLEDGGYH